MHYKFSHTLHPLTNTNPWTLKTDLQEFSRSILGRWQSLYSSIRSSNLGLCPGSEVSNLSWHAEAVWPTGPSLRVEWKKTTLTVLQCQVSVQIAAHWARDNEGREKASQVKDKDCNHSCLGWHSVRKQCLCHNGNFLQCHSLPVQA